MTRRDWIVKWALYALVVLPVWFLELFLLNRVKLFGVSPMLLPLTAVAVAVLEGSGAAAGFGLAIGILCDAAYGTAGAMTLAIAFLGAAAGVAAQYRLKQNLTGYMICAGGMLLAIDAGRVLWRLFAGVAPLSALVRVAAPEVAYSLCLAPLVYLLFRVVYDHTRFATLF